MKSNSTESHAPPPLNVKWTVNESGQRTLPVFTAEESLMYSIRDNVEQSHLHHYGQNEQHKHFLINLFIYFSLVESASFHEATFKWLRRNYKCALWSKQSLIYVRSPFPLFLLCFKCCAWFSCAVGTGWRSPCSSLCGCLRWHLTRSATAELAAQPSRERAFSHPLPQLRPLHLPLSSHYRWVNKRKRRKEEKNSIFLEWVKIWLLSYWHQCPVDLCAWVLRGFQGPWIMKVTQQINGFVNIQIKEQKRKQQNDRDLCFFPPWTAGISKSINILCLCCHLAVC